MIKGPLLMTAENIQKSIDGVKTQTRRIEKLRLLNYNPDIWDSMGVCIGDPIAPRHQVGDICYLPEPTFITEDTSPHDNKPVYLCEFSDGQIYYYDWYEVPDKNVEQLKKCKKWVWRSPCFMFKFMARYFVEITGVKCERLQDITPEDIEAEGVLLPDGYLLFEKYVIDSALREAWQELWDSINGKTYPWASNPWVFAYTYRMVKYEA